MEFIKIYGLQRTGTNYLEELILKNFKDVLPLTNVLGWKHGEVRDFSEKQKIDKLPDNQQKELTKKIDNNKVKSVFLFKNPYSWVVSAKKYFNGTLGENRDLNDLIDNYNKVNKNYMDTLQTDNDNSYLLLYENLIENPEKEIRDISDKFGFERNEEFKDEENIIGPNKTITKKHFDRGKYLNKKYLYELAGVEIEKINDNIDHQLLEVLGYKNNV